MRAAIVVLVGLLSYPFSAHATDCSSQVSAAFAKLRSSKAFRLETRITNAQGKLYMTVDYVTPDRMYQRIRLDEQPTEMELIVVGHDAWSNQGQGWAKLPENFASAVSAQVRNTLLGGQQGGLSYECGARRSSMDGVLQSFELIFHRRARRSGQSRRVSAPRRRMCRPSTSIRKPGFRCAMSSPTDAIQTSGSLTARSASSTTSRSSRPLPSAERMVRHRRCLTPICPSGPGSAGARSA